MKQTVSLMLIAVFLLFAVGCSGVSQEDYDALVAERDALAEELIAANGQVTSLSAENKTLSSQKEWYEKEKSRLESENAALINENEWLSKGITDYSETLESLQEEFKEVCLETAKIVADSQGYSTSYVRSEKKFYVFVPHDFTAAELKAVSVSTFNLIADSYKELSLSIKGLTDKADPEIKVIVSCMDRSQEIFLIIQDGIVIVDEISP